VNESPHLEEKNIFTKCEILYFYIILIWLRKFDYSERIKVQAIFSNHNEMKSMLFVLANKIDEFFSHLKKIYWKGLIFLIIL